MEFRYAQLEGAAAKIQQIIPREACVWAMKDRTQFYGDAGTAVCNGRTMLVVDAMRDAQGNVLHKAVDAERLSVGDEVLCGIERLSATTRRRIFYIQRSRQAKWIVCGQSRASVWF